MKNRVIWIDIAKAIGIILVVIGHTVRGMMNAGISDGGPFLPSFDNAIYAFHMPFFFILSGVTFGMKPRAPLYPALWTRSLRLFYTLVLWTYVFLVMRGFAGDLSNVGGSFKDLLIWPLPPFAHFWFLWALLLNIIFFTLLRHLLAPITSETGFWITACVLSAAANLILSLPPFLIPWFALAQQYSMAFLVGGLIGTSPWVRTVPNWPNTIISMIVFVISLWMFLSYTPPISSVITGIGLSVILIIPLTKIAHRIGQTKWAQSFAFLGNISLAIYVMHTIFSAGTRIVLQQIGIDDMILHLFIGTAAGIIGPLVAYLFLRRIGKLPLFGLG